MCPQCPGKVPIVSHTRYKNNSKPNVDIETYKYDGFAIDKNERKTN